MIGRLRRTLGLVAKVQQLEAALAASRAEVAAQQTTIAAQGENLVQLTESVTAQSAALEAYDTRLRQLEEGRVANPTTATFDRLDGPRSETVGVDLDNYWAQLDINYPSTAPFVAYEDFVQRVDQHERLAPMSMRRFVSEPDPGRVTLGMRHDIDADPLTAVRMARCLARYGVGGTFFVLHTSPYYGRYDGDLLIRTPELSRWVDQLIVAGAEIGIHNDALGVWERQGIDGGVTLQRELAFLRSLGADVVGTAGHNSAPSYGAENCEVLAGHVLIEREASSEIAARLGTISPDALGLSYEGTMAARRQAPDRERIAAWIADAASCSTENEDWMRPYLGDNPMIEWQVDGQLWSHVDGSWTLGGAAVPWLWKAPLDTALDAIAALDAGSRILAVLHPIHFRG